MKLRISQELYKLLNNNDVVIPGLSYNELWHKRKMFREYNLIDIIDDYDNILPVIITIEEMYDIHIDEPANIGDIIELIEEVML